MGGSLLEGIVKSDNFDGMVDIIEPSIQGFPKEDFKQRKDEWVKRLRLDPGIEETMYIVMDHLSEKKMASVEK